MPRRWARVAAAAAPLVLAALAATACSTGPAASQGLVDDEQCTAYNADITAANDTPTDAFDQAHGLTVAQSTDMLGECVNYPCETLAQAVAAVQSATWSATFSEDKKQYAGPCG